MTNIIQVKRRISGQPGAPSLLKSGEPAHNEVDDTLYIGKGDDGAGNATSVVPVAGAGAFVDRSSAQTVSGAKTFSTVPKSTQDAAANNDLVRKSQLDAGLSARGDMFKSVYDANDDGKIDVAELAESAPWTGITGKPASFPPSPHTHAIGEVTNLQAALDSKAPLASPALTGTPTAPTAASSVNTTQIATTAFVQAVVSDLINGAPGALDTLQELAAALGDDPNFATTITNDIATKAAKAANLSDLTDAAAARTNIGLGTMATQNANNVAITGGTIDGTVIDGGTF